MDPFRLATFNVRCFPWTSPAIAEIVAWIVRSCDIAAFQEIWCRHDVWATAFAAHGWTFSHPTRESHIASIFGSGLAVAWRSDTWRLTESRFYPFLSAVGLDTFVTKGWYRVELRRNSSNHLRLINTHMQADYDICQELWRPIAEPVRMAQALQMVETETQMPWMPTLFVGDMNTDMCWLPHCRWLTLHRGPTFPATSQILDHCATYDGEPWTVRQHRVYAHDWSDHWPVVWELAYAGRAARRCRTCGR